MTRKAKTDICPICRGTKMYWIMVYDGGRAGNVLKPIGCSVCGGTGAISLALLEKELEGRPLDALIHGPMAEAIFPFSSRINQLGTE